MVIVDAPELPAATVRLVAVSVNDAVEELVEEPTVTITVPVEAA
jgi:hypothetical protein